MKSFESASLMKNESDAIEAAIRMLKSEFSILKRWLSRKARATLIPWFHEVDTDNSLKFNRVFVKCQRTRWASCSRHKAISLNLKLLFLPMHLVRYVFIHELCHTIHMNHSQKYWAFLASREPRYVSLDKELRGAWRRVPPWVG